MTKPKEVKTITKSEFKRMFRYAINFVETIDYYDMVTNLGWHEAMNYIYGYYIKKYHTKKQK